MRSRSSLLAALALSLVATAGCQKPDVGGDCTLAWNPTYERDGTAMPPLATETTSDYFESGNLACDGLVCIISHVSPNSTYDRPRGIGYCSKPCVSNSDCYQSDTGLVCRQMVLDPVFLETLDAATRQRYLADIQYSSYCAVPGT